MLSLAIIVDLNISSTADWQIVHIVLITITNKIRK